MMTKARKAILETLVHAAEPLTAASVHAAAGILVDQVTVYRTLHFLEEKGLAESFILHCADHGTERYYTSAPDAGSGEPVHRHWFHCERCHRFIDLGECTLAALVRGYETEYGLAVHSHTLYLTGICSQCKE